MDNASKGDRNARVNHAKEICGLCDVAHPSPSKSFVLCKKFLEMKPKERCNLVHRKKKCLQCLDGVAKWNNKEHVKNCCSKWVCQNSSHADYDRKLHFLICEAHAGEDANLVLFENFKTEILKAEWQLRLFRGKSGYFISSKFVRRNVQKKKLGTGVVEDSDKICDDFAAQINGGSVSGVVHVAEDENDICGDFAAQIGVSSPLLNDNTQVEQLAVASVKKG